MVSNAINSPAPHDIVFERHTKQPIERRPDIASCSILRLVKPVGPSRPFLNALSTSRTLPSDWWPCFAQRRQRRVRKAVNAGEGDE
jgi:hypothetical protein